MTVGDNTKPVYWRTPNPRRAPLPKFVSTGLQPVCFWAVPAHSAEFTTNGTPSVMPLVKTNRA